MRLAEFIALLQTGTFDVSEAITIDVADLNDEAAARLILALNTHPCQYGLKLSLLGNTFSMESRQQLVDILKENTRITQLDLGVLIPRQSLMLRLLLQRNNYIAQYPYLESSITALFHKEHPTLSGKIPALIRLSAQRVIKPDAHQAELPPEVNNILKLEALLEEFGIKAAFHGDPYVSELRLLFGTALQKRLEKVRELNKVSYFSQWFSYFTEHDGIGPKGVTKTKSFWKTFTHRSEPLSMLRDIIIEIKREPKSRLSKLLKKTLVNYLISKENEVLCQEEPAADQINLAQEVIAALVDPLVASSFLEHKIAEVPHSASVALAVSMYWADQIQNNTIQRHAEYQQWCRDHVIDKYFNHYATKDLGSDIIKNHMRLQTGSGPAVVLTI